MTAVICWSRNTSIVASRAGASANAISQMCVTWNGSTTQPRPGLVVCKHARRTFNDMLSATHRSNRNVVIETKAKGIMGRKCSEDIISKQTVKRRSCAESGKTSRFMVMKKNKFEFLVTTGKKPGSARN